MVLIPQRAQSCRTAVVAVMVVDVHVMKDRTHVKMEAYQKDLRTINHEPAPNART